MFFQNFKKYSKFQKNEVVHLQKASEIKVVTSIKPIHSLVSYVMDGVGTPDLIVDGFNSPHNFQLKPSHAKMLENADIIFWIGEGLENFLEKPLDSISNRLKSGSINEVSFISFTLLEKMRK